MSRPVLTASPCYLCNAPAVATVRQGEGWAPVCRAHVPDDDPADLGDELEDFDRLAWVAR
jgi:hypothetical protein